MYAFIQKNLITVSLLLSVFPGISWADRVDVPVYVEESLGPNWQSMTIGTTSTSTSGMVPPVAHGTRSIAIGNNAVAGTEIEKPQVGEAIAIGSKANATKSSLWQLVLTPTPLAGGASSSGATIYGPYTENLWAPDRPGCLSGFNCLRNRFCCNWQPHAIRWGVVAGSGLYRFCER